MRAARVNAGYSQENAAALLKISPYTLSNWERGVSMPKANYIDAICDLYNVTFDMLIFLPKKSALSQS
jgi:transcriptional regulator with XRE-family HTH domain